ncbi:MAG TPA: PD-(D/E)XK nuclease family protein, partial [Polyangiaceae bacterium]|nr:PD-(D/E)XK nuclease family protein [Polyangiaceae bacterium]
LLKLVLDPHDRHALATALRGPALGLTDTSLARLSEPGRGLASESEWFRDPRVAARLPDDERERLARFAERLATLRALGSKLGVADTIRYAVEKLDLDRVMAALPRASVRLGNVDRLVALAARRGGSLPAFVRWLGEQIADQGDESEAAVLSDADDAVTLMTIHASKGLEFRAVVLVDMAAAPRAEPLTLALSPARASQPARLIMRHVQRLGGTQFTPEAAEYSKEASARETAERRRLTYVAMTRARERLYLLVPPPPVPNGSAAATLRRSLHVLSASRETEIVVEPVAPYLSAKPVSDRPVERTVDVPRLPGLLAPTTEGPIAISTTPLGTFAACPRKYRLLHELAVEPPARRLDEAGPAPATSDDPRTLGTAAHRVLEKWPLERWGRDVDPRAVAELLAREGLLPSAASTLEMTASLARFLGGPYASHVRSASAVRREEPFVLRIATTGGELSLRGTIDLLVAYPDGSADVIDYKTSWGGRREGPSFQLLSYALAATRRFGFAKVRASIVDLSASAEPLHLAEVEEATLAEFERKLAHLRADFMLARTSAHFPGVELARCNEQRCGFVAACHYR